MDVQLSSSSSRAQVSPQDLGAELLPRLRIADLDGIMSYSCEEPAVPGRERIQLDVRLSDGEGEAPRLCCSLRSESGMLYEGVVPLGSSTPQARAFELLELFATYGGRYLHGVLSEDRMIADRHQGKFCMTSPAKPPFLPQWRRVSGSEQQAWVSLQSNERGHELTLSPTGKRLGQKLVVSCGRRQGSSERVKAELQRTVGLLASGEETECVAAVLGLVRNFGATVRFDGGAGPRVPMLCEVRRQLLACDLPPEVSLRDTLSTAPSWWSALPQLLQAREYLVVRAPTLSDLTPSGMRLWFDRRGDGVIEIVNRRALEQPDSAQRIRLCFWVAADPVRGRTEGLVSEAARRFAQDPAGGVRFLSRNFALADGFSNPGDGLANGAPLGAWLGVTRWYDAIADLEGQSKRHFHTFTRNPTAVELELCFQGRFGVSFSVTAGPDGERFLRILRAPFGGRERSMTLPLLQTLGIGERQAIVREFMRIGWRSLFKRFDDLPFVRVARGIAGHGLDS